MKPDQLKNLVENHTGEFFCEKIYQSDETKIVAFHHQIQAPSAIEKLPDVPGLSDFYAVFGSILFYFDENSGEAARYLAHPKQWPQLQAEFDDWIEGLRDTIPDEEQGDFFPSWIDHCLVIGETPRSGNYILMPFQGQETGQVFEFDHDEYEFTHEADSLINYVERMLKPDTQRLTNFASHIRFIEEDSDAQWWIESMRDNHGNLVKTEA